MKKKTKNLIVYIPLVIILQMIAVFFIVGNIELENRYYEAGIIFAIILIGNLIILILKKYYNKNWSLRTNF